MRHVRLVLLCIAFVACASLASSAAFADSSWAPMLVEAPAGGNLPFTTAISDTGQVVGQDLRGQAFSWSPADGFSEIGLGGSFGTANAVNASGLVVGVASVDDGSGNQAFTWTHADGIHAITVPPAGFEDSARSVSDSGVVYGVRVNDADSTNSAWSWTKLGGFVDLGPIPTPVAGARVNIEAVSPTGVFVGLWVEEGGFAHAFSWSSASGTVPLDEPPGSIASAAMAVNARGDVGGISGDGNDGQIVKWVDRNVVSLTGPVDQPDMTTTSLANNGEVVGWYYTQTGQRAYAWPQGGDPIDLGTLGGPNSEANAVSETGVVVGDSYTPQSRASDGFAWTAAKGMIDLGPFTSDTEGSTARVISRNGVFIGGYRLFGPDVLPQIVVWQNTDQAPAITSAAAAGVAMRSAFDFQITTSGSPAAAISEAGPLPAGVALVDNGDGTAELAGSAAAGTAGSYPITITASNGIGNAAHQSFVLSVTSAPSRPAITSVPADSETFGVPFNFVVTTSGFPVPKLSKTGGLPAGLTFTDNGDGSATLTGTPAKGAIGAYPLTLTAKSTAGTGTQSFTLTITKAPTIKKIPTTTAMVGVSVTIPITTKGFTVPAISNVSGLPSGLAVTDHGDGTGTITGIPDVGTGGSSSVTVTASNSLGSASLSFTLKVDEGPAFTSPNTAAARSGSAFSFPVTATGFPAPRFSKTGTLPKGVAFNAATGTLSGTPKAGTAGVYSITLTARNSTATVTQPFELTVT